MAQIKELKTEMTLEQLIERLYGSDRIQITNAANQTVYRGYAASAMDGLGIDLQRKVRRVGIGLESYRKTDTMWDWKKIDKLPPQVPFESIPEYNIGDLTQLLFIRIQLCSDFE